MFLKFFSPFVQWLFVTSLQVIYVFILYFPTAITDCIPARLFKSFPRNFVAGFWLVSSFLHALTFLWCLMLGRIWVFLFFLVLQQIFQGSPSTSLLTRSCFWKVSPPASCSMKTSSSGCWISFGFFLSASAWDSSRKTDLVSHFKPFNYLFFSSLHLTAFSNMLRQHDHDFHNINILSKCCLPTSTEMRNALGSPIRNN